MHPIAPFVCREPGCTFRSRWKYNLKIHRLTHTREKPFKCDYRNCQKSFAAASSLAVHERVHTGERPYICDYDDCGKAFKTSGALRDHGRTHTKERPYVCGECQRKFSQSSNLAKHMRTHSGDRPHVCPHPGCEQAFAQSGTLIAHQRAHTGERPYRCKHTGCDFAASQATHLVAHGRTHTGEKPYKCCFPQCEAVFTTKTHLNEHSKRIHSELGGQRQKRQEERIAKALRAAGVHFKREHHVDTSCGGGTFAREDFVIDHAPGGLISLEIDENQHGGQVGCDLKRTQDIRNALMISGNTLPRLLIRYNPDAFCVDGLRRTVPKKERERCLVDIIKSFSFSQAPDFRMLYVFFDAHTTSNGLLPDAFDDPDYFEDYKNTCLPCVTEPAVTYNM